LRTQTVLTLLLLVVASCQRAPLTETGVYAIVGGQDESGWPEAGALTWEMPGYGYHGVFCSAALIAPQWVITAGHCVEEVSGVPLTAEMISFYVGTHTTGGPEGPDEGGPLYQVDEIVQHPLYNPLFHFNDLALLHLASPVEDVEPARLRFEPIAESMLGDDLFIVGFGLGSGEETYGKGHKRSGAMPLSDVQSNIVQTTFAGTGVCFGDSGAPAFLPNQEGVFELAATVSGLTDEIPDPCKGGAVHSRIDYYYDWIMETTGLPMITDVSVAEDFADEVSQSDAAAPEIDLDTTGAAELTTDMAPDLANLEPEVGSADIESEEIVSAADSAAESESPAPSGGCGLVASTGSFGCWLLLLSLVATMAILRREPQTSPST
jgi:secreted trypsin-like serine protease